MVLFFLKEEENHSHVNVIDTHRHTYTIDKHKHTIQMGLHPEQKMRNAVLA